MIKKNNEKKDFYFVSTGDWSTVTLAENKSCALNQVFEELLNNPQKFGGVGEVVICMNVDQAMRDLSLEDSLKFIPTEEAIDVTGLKNISDFMPEDEDEF
jgi:glucose-6-phosphate-specific signal transduction histidine kinase